MLAKGLHPHHASILSHAHTHKGHSWASSFILSCCSHSLRHTTSHISCTHIRIYQGCSALVLLQLGFILVAGLYGINTKVYNLNASVLRPFLAKHLIKGICQLHSMSQDFIIFNPHGRKLGKGRLESCQKLTL